MYAHIIRIVKTSHHQNIIIIVSYLYYRSLWHYYISELLEYDHIIGIWQLLSYLLEYGKCHHLLLFLEYGIYYHIYYWNMKY